MGYNEKRKLAGNPSTPEDVLRDLAQDEYWGVRWRVAKNSSTSLGILRDLAKDGSASVRATVAENPSTPVDVLRALAKDEHWGVRESVAKHPKASSKLLVMLFEYEKSLREPVNDVILALYHNDNCPEFIKSVIKTLFGEML